MWLLDKEKLNFCVLFLPSCLSLSGPQWRDKLTPPQSLFVSFIPTETFQRERSVNIHHRKTGVWPPRRPSHSAVILIILCDMLTFYLGLSALLFARTAQRNEARRSVFAFISALWEISCFNIRPHLKSINTSLTCAELSSLHVFV